MDSTISVKSLLSILLTLGFVAASAFAVVYYKRAVASESRAQTLVTKLNDLNMQLNKSRSQLNQAVDQLKQTTGQLSEAQAESQHRLSLIFAQEDNVKVLKSCLTGVAADDMYFRKGTDSLFTWVDSRSDDDLNTALDNFKMGRGALDSVSDDCGQAAHLLQ